MLKRLEEAMKRWHLAAALLVTMTGIVASLIYFGVTLGRQLTENMLATSRLREMNTNIKAILSWQAASEADKEELMRLLSENSRHLSETISQVTSTRETIQRHIQEERESRWWMLHRLDGLDHKGIKDKPNGSNGR